MTAHPAASGDALIVGGGPAGLATAIELGRRGRRVLVVDRSDVERGDLDEGDLLLTPRAVAAAWRLGLEPDSLGHPIDRVRITSTVGIDEVSSSVTWPSMRTTPDIGRVTARADVVGALRALADEFGVVRLHGHDALEPVIERGFVRGAVVRHPDGTTFEARATYTVVADGSNSSFGRMLGTYREPEWPFALAHAGSFPSPLHATGDAEFVVGVTDRSGVPIAGYGWLYPTGRGVVSVGVMLMSTSPSFQVIHPSHLFDRFVAERRAPWQLDGAPVTPAIGGRIPMGLSVGPLAGPTYLIVGDAGGTANPMSGTGIETALETGTIAADVLGEAFETGDATALQAYPHLLDERYGTYYKVGRLGQRLLGRPSVSRRVHERITRHGRSTTTALRITAQHLRSGRGGGAELAYRIARAVSAFAPDA